MISLFPVLPSVVSATSAAKSLPLCREVAWDFERGVPIFESGNPVIAEGADAVAVWIWHALRTVRGRHRIYTMDYGSDVEALVGQPYTEAIKQSEAIRYVREAILINPYVVSVNDVSVSFAGDDLTISCTVKTVYGEVSVNAA